MLKICAVIKAKANLTREEFIYFWQVEHPAVVRALPGVRRYVQNMSIEHRSEWPFQGVAEVYFDSKKDIAVAFSSPAADVMREHEKKFVEEIEWIITRETEVPLRETGAREVG